MRVGTVARIAVGCIVVFAVLGTIDATGIAALPPFDLDVEGTVPTAFSGLLLLGAAALAWLAGRERQCPPRAAFALAGLFAFMALDEVFRLHEELDSLVNFDWQVIYLPVVVWIGVAWAAVLRTLPAGLPRQAWICAAFAWSISQILEAFQWDGAVRPGAIDGAGLTEPQFQARLSEPGYVAMSVPEEILEMLGSLLFMLVLLSVVRQARARRRDAPLTAGSQS